MSVANQLMYTTILIHTKSENAEATGTGFCFNFQCSLDVPVLVTNRHVCKGFDSFSIRFHTRGSIEGTAPEKHINLNMDKFQEHWIYHPIDNVDLAILPLLSIANYIT